MLVTVSGSPNVARQYEYDGLGRLTSVCEVNSGTGSGKCGQSVQPTGYWTKYTYDVLNDLLTVNQNAQPGGTLQTRTYAYDGLGRMTSEKNPETNQTAYTYTFDTESGSCNATHDGDLVKRIDPQGTVTCYAYDALHRLTGVTYPSGGYSSVTPAKTYVYDAATVDSTAMLYPAGRLAEAYTGSPSSKTTDLGFSYSNRGEVAAVYQSSPHSGGYYNIAATYWAPQGLLEKLTPNMGASIPNWTYTPEGEGRVNTVSASSGTNPVSGTSYNGFSEVLGITFGSADSDAFTYDPNTGRMTQYKANVGSSSMTGTPTWNANWTLGTLGIVDGLNSKDTQSCSYAYDNLARLTTANCGSTIWSQSFTYDAFGNINKSGTQSFMPTYSETTNRYTLIGSVTPTYDSNGNLTNDGFYTYTWDGEGNLATLNGNAETYDALDRRVEQYNGSAYTEIVYGPAGNKFALMSGQTATKVFAPLSGGATAVYTSSGLSYYRHPDWLGSSRVASTPTQTLYYDGAYAPFGENYAETGTTDRNFTGQNQDLTPGATAPLYDFPYREYHSTQGRRVSPDPAGVAAVDPTNPQSWNRYGYGLNNPCGVVDPLGLSNCTLKIYANNQAGVNLKAVGGQINTLLGSVASPNGDTVGAVLVPASQASYTVNFVKGDPYGNFGSTPSYLGLFSFGSSTVNAAAVSQFFSMSPQAVEDAAMGTVAAHELTHLITNISDLPYGDSFPVLPNLMQVNNLQDQDPQWFGHLFSLPLGFPPSPAQVAALYSQCKQKQDQNHLGGGGMGSGSGFGTYDMQGLLCLVQGCTPYPNSPDCPNGDCKAQ